MAATPAASASKYVREAKTHHALVLWGVLGFCLLLVRAIWSLTPNAVAPLRDGSLTGLQIGLFAAWVVFMAWSEGYKGFQRQLAPRLVARGLHLARHPRAVHALLAPFFCMGLFHATRKRLITSWSLLSGIVALVVAVRRLDQPWRGIVDGGVVVGLVWGLVAILVYLAIGLGGKPLQVSPDLPESDEVEE